MYGCVRLAGIHANISIIDNMDRNVWKIKERSELEKRRTRRSHAGNGYPRPEVSVQIPIAPFVRSRPPKQGIISPLTTRAYFHKVEGSGFPGERIMARWSETRGLLVKKKKKNERTDLAWRWFVKVRETRVALLEKITRGCVLERKGTTFSTAYKSSCDEGLIIAIVHELQPLGCARWRPYSTKDTRIRCFVTDALASSTLLRLLSFGG